MPPAINPAFNKNSQSAATLNSPAGGGFPISSTLSTTNPGPITWATAQQGRPTLSGGIPGGRVSGMIYIFPLFLQYMNTDVMVFYQAHLPSFLVQLMMLVFSTLMTQAIVEKIHQMIKV